MLSKEQEKLIKSLHTKKGREKSGFCLVEGQKIIDTAKDFIEYTFTSADTNQFDKLVTTETPQSIAAVAKTPKWTETDILEKPITLILDGVQDPGNTGAIFRLCLAFNASLVLVEAVDPTNTKVIRSSAGALFHVPYLRMNSNEAQRFLLNQKRPLYRLEKRERSIPFSEIKKEPAIIIAGSEGSGISLPIEGTSMVIPHQEDLESLNVANATAIILQYLYT